MWMYNFWNSVKDFDWHGSRKINGNRYQGDGMNNYPRNHNSKKRTLSKAKNKRGKAARKKQRSRK